MKRRDFLKGVAAASGTAILGQCPASVAAEQAAQRIAAPPVVRTVHVIFKTHLDVGFTDGAANVIRRYFEDFIPRAMELAAQTRAAGTPERFVWTTGSWLIYEFLEKAPAALRRKMEQAIEAEDMVWHGLPFTTHTELMDGSLWRLGLRISAALDKRFGRKTISAKMTDVPGHTRSIIRPLADAGIRFLHIGVNPASTPPSVPPLCVWREKDGADIVLMYQTEYGSTMTLPRSDVAVAVSFTGDNHGPQSPQEVAKIYEDLRRRFPGANVIPSTFNAVAEAADRLQPTLPVVTQELGDTWIHGGASDPVKMSRFRAMSRLRRQWLNDGTLKEGDELDLAFGRHLLLVPEHTWGRDVKRFLGEWGIYDPDKFLPARSTPKFRMMEDSWNEKRAYVDEAVALLPPALAPTAKNSLKELEPREPALDGLADLEPSREIQSPDWLAALDPATGALRRLLHRKTGREWASGDHLLGLFSYQTFSQTDYDRFLNQYLTRKVDWAFGDFGKLGLEKTSARTASWNASLKQAWSGQAQSGPVVLTQLAIDNAAPGCPRRIFTRWLFAPQSVHVELTWFDKPALRLPEASWLSFTPVAPNANGWTMDKMGQTVSPLEVIENGNRHMHAVVDGVRYSDEKGGLAIDTLDAPLVAPGQKSLLDFNNRQPDMAGGMHFNLHNNVWGTNFRLWLDDNMLFRFTLRLA